MLLLRKYHLKSLFCLFNPNTKIYIILSFLPDVFLREVEENLFGWTSSNGSYVPF